MQRLTTKIFLAGFLLGCAIKPIPEEEPSNSSKSCQAPLEVTVVKTVKSEYTNLLFQRVGSEMQALVYFSNINKLMPWYKCALQYHISDESVLTDCQRQGYTGGTWKDFFNPGDVVDCELKGLIETAVRAHYKDMIFAAGGCDPQELKEGWVCL